jgi:uncharacterized membrane protein YeaQ/YmgE (transglycosylase-associated protein family)
MANIVIWLLFGLLAGFVFSRLSDHMAPGIVVVNCVTGMLGATLAGVMLLIFDATPLNDISLWSLIAAFIGALVVIFLVRFIFGSSYERLEWHD